MEKLLQFFKIIIWGYAFVYLVCCLTPYISPLHFPPFTFLALLFPCFFLGMLVVLLLGIFILKKRSFFLLLILLLGYKNIFSTIGLHQSKQFTQQKSPDNIRLLSWNVDDFVDCAKQNEYPGCPLRNIFNFIKSTEADVLCFQDYSNYSKNEFMTSSLKFLVDTLNYKYYYFSVDDPCTKEYFPRRYGTIILSKFPIIDSGRIAYNRKHAPEHLMYATINIHGKEIRFYNTHLRSMFLGWRPENEHPITKPFLIDDSAVLTDGDKEEKLKYFDSVHVWQAEQVKQELNKCKLPFVFCADLNSVPSSYVYQHISSGLNDAFLQNSFGWGGTYSTISPTIRIDVALMSKQLNATQYYSPHLENASDHYPVVADIKIN